ncbi:hypothetical protein ACHAW6_014371 [Cyclotella cf. meneghiniana]
MEWTDIRKNIPLQPSEYNLMRHLDQKCQGIRSTKSSSDSTTPMAEPQQLPLNDKRNMVAFCTAKMVTSNRGNNYIGMFYAGNANPIKSYPLKLHHRTELVCAYNNLYVYLHMQGYCPQLHKPDNESSHNPNMPPAPNHCVAMHAGTDKSDHLSNWCKDLEQTDITLNMMNPCTQNPNLSAHQAIEVIFSFDATPMTPIGTECMINNKPVNCHTWGCHDIKTWFLALALNRYRCIKTVTDTRAVHTADTFNFLYHTLLSVMQIASPMQ